MSKKKTVPAVGIEEGSLRGIVQDVEELGKKSKRMAEKGVTRFITKSAWQALKEGKNVAVLRVYTKGELHRKFGDYPEEHVVEVKISLVEN